MQRNLTLSMLKSDQQESPSWFMFELKCELTGIIFLPFCFQHHWTLFIVNADKGTCSHVDPMGHETNSTYRYRATKCFENFCKYMYSSRQKSDFSQKGIYWKYVRYPRNNRRPLQKDWKSETDVFIAMELEKKEDYFVIVATDFSMKTA